MPAPAGVVAAVRAREPLICPHPPHSSAPLAILPMAFIPAELLAGWFKIAVAENPVDYGLVGIRTIIVVGWDWAAILMGLWVLVAMAVVLMTGATCVYRRAST